MSRAWDDAIQEFNAMTAAMNAGALARAGLLPEADRKSMLVYLTTAEKVARTPDQRAIVFSLHHLLGASVTPQEPARGSNATEAVSATFASTPKKVDLNNKANAPSFDNNRSEEDF